MGRIRIFMKYTVKVTWFQRRGIGCGTHLVSLVYMCVCDYIRKREGLLGTMVSLTF